MEYLLFFAIILILTGTVFYLHRELQYLKNHQPDSESQKLMFEMLEALRADVRGSIDKNTTHVQGRLDQTLKMVTQRLDHNAKVIMDVKEDLGHMKEIGGHMKKLQEVFGGQKLRGNFGEQLMQNLISQIIPKEFYTMQYEFSSGDTVDAIIQTQNGSIPIDSKFPLENFKTLLSAVEEKKDSLSKVFARDVKKHITDIHKKYIRPEEGTMDFAFMYVPADSVYFEIVANTPELNNFAQARNVYIVSPSMFYSALQIILLSFQSQKFEENAKKVLQHIQGVKKESQKFGEHLSVLNKHVSHAKNKIDEVQNQYNVLDTKIQQTDNLDLTITSKEQELLKEIV